MPLTSGRSPHGRSMGNRMKAVQHEHVTAGTQDACSLAYLCAYVSRLGRLFLQNLRKPCTRMPLRGAVLWLRSCWPSTDAECDMKCLVHGEYDPRAAYKGRCPYCILAEERRRQAVAAQYLKDHR